MRPNRLVGHALHREGAPVLDTTGDGRTGAALCSCGAKSPVLPSDRQRRQWHRDHKNDIRSERGLAR